MRRHRCDLRGTSTASVMRLSSQCTRIPSTLDSFSRTGALPLSPSHLGQRPRERRATPHARARFNLSSREMDPRDLQDEMKGSMEDCKRSQVCNDSFGDPSLQSTL
jgi:hypothetical protein